MGMFDSVMLACPECGTRNEFQSKGGECLLNTYDETNAPTDVLTDVNRHSPTKCSKCGTLYEAQVTFNPVVRVILSNGGTQRPASPDVPLATETGKPGSLQRLVMPALHSMSCPWPEGCKCGASDWNRLEQERDWYRSRVRLLEKSKAMFREPELTIICDIMANGQLLPDPDGTRYGHNSKTHPPEGLG